MPTTRKQKKARKSRGLELLSDIENLDIMLGERHSERDVSVDRNSVRRQDSNTSDMFENNDENMYLNNVETRPGNSTSRDQNSASGNSSAEINKLSSEPNSRLSRKMDEMMRSVNAQIQMEINDPISNQISPQIAQLERELELNALEESDDLPMATMTSSSSKTKTPLFTEQTSDITCIFCKEKGHMVKYCKKHKKKKKDVQQDKSTQKKTYPECGSCGKKPPRRKMLARCRCAPQTQAHLRIQVTTNPTEKPKNRSINQHRPTLNPHPRTSFATTPI